MNLKSSWKIFLVAMLLVAAQLSAQDNGGTVASDGPLSLEQCIDYALANSINAQNATLDEQIAAAKVKETVGIGLPQISGSASVNHNQKLQRFYGTYNDDPNAFSFFPAGIPGAQNGDVLAAPNFFQLKSSGNASVTVNQMIFNGSYIVGLQASNTFKELSQKTSEQTREQIVEQVTKAYYAVLINRERMLLFDANIARVDSLLRNTRALNISGFAEKIDVDRIQVSFNNLVTERDKFSNMNALGLAILKFQMNYPMEQPIEVAGTIQDVQLDPIEKLNGSDWDYKNRPDYKVLEVNRRLQELNIKNLYAEALPSMNAFATLGYSTQSNGIGGIFRTESSIEDSDLVGPDKWYDYSQFGLSLNVPIFGGLQRTYKIQQEKLTLQKLDNGFKSLENLIDLEIQQSYLNFDNAQKSLASQEENMELAESIARVTKIKYEQGVGSNLEVIDAENSLRNAQTNYYSALYDAIVAKVDLDKAKGLLIKE
ncbi:MAG: TolC family protein [Imperialibacter sp.]|uniref:TolC family protein n=1 Tax=Imperialibacter sp. TaxID=2038411 RepID=UPI0032ED7BB5